MNILRYSRMKRRELLQLTAAGSALLPFVPLMEAHGQDSAFPKRLFIFFSSNGTIHESWLPSSSGDELQLSPILAPLEEHKAETLVIDGLQHSVVMDLGEKTGHYGGMNTVLTGQRALIIDPNDEDGNSLADGISVDQRIAQANPRGTAFKSIEAGIQVESYSPTVAALSYAGAKQPILPDNDAHRVFERIFDGFSPANMADPQLERRQRDQASVLDHVARELQQLQPKISSGDRFKLEVHLSQVRDMERALQQGNARATDSCEPPSLDGGLDVQENDNIPAIARVQMKNILMAMACDLTRIGTLQHGRAGAQHRFTWLGFTQDPDNGPNDSTRGIHALAHDESNPDSRAKLVEINKWYASEVAEVVSWLKSVPEGDGSMFDSSLVLWINEMGTGNHSLRNTPWVLLAGKNFSDTLRTGRVLSFPEESHNKLLINILNAMDVDDQRFGHPDYGTGPLPGLA